MRKLKLFLSLLMLISFSVGTVWGQAPAGTTLFSEDFSSYKKDNVPTGSVTTATGRVVYGNANVTYSVTNGGGTTKIYTENTAGGTSPEILVAKSSGTFVVAGIPSGDAKVITVSYKQNKQELTVAASGTGYSGSLKNKPSSSVTNSFDITVADGAAATFTLTFTGSGSSNVRVDDILVTVKTAGEGATPTCVNPTFDPIDGTKFTESQDVEISTETEGATIYYTLDGSTPTTSSNVYSSAINLTATTTIKAIAAKADYDNSSVVSATYTRIIPVPGYDVDFESELDLYTDWKFTNAAIGTNGDNSNINAHAGTHYGTTGGKSTASYETKAKIANPGTFTCYVSKQSNNTTTSTWYIQVSSDGSSWTDVKSQSATSMSAGTWVEFSADLSEYNNVYVRLYYSGGTAVRNVDDISLQMAATKYNITISDAIEHGTVTSDKSTATAGETVTLTATPDEHYSFVSWSVNGGDVTVTDNKFTMPDGNVTVSATFEEIKNVVTLAAPTGGTLSVLNGEDEVASGTSIKEGTELTVTATPNAANHYIGGVVTVTKTSDASDVTKDVLSGTTLTMPGYAITISASFTATYAINIVADGGNVALDYTKGGAEDGYAIAGTVITAEAIADDAHTFSSLALSENVTEKEIVDEIAEFTMPAGAVTITATFEVISTPTIGVSTSSIAFGAVDYKGALAAQKFNVSGAALAAGQLTLACNNDAFTVSPTAIDVDGDLAATEITVTPKTVACGTFNGKITISGGNAEAKEVTLSLTVNKLAANLSWSADEYTATIGEENTFPTLNNPRGLENIVYSSSDEDVVTVNATTGAITELKKADQAFIIANFAGNDTVAAIAVDELLYTLTVQKKYTITWHVNGATQTTKVLKDAIITPIDDPELSSDYEEKVFKGWLTTELATTDEEPSFVDFSALTATADADYYAVFATKGTKESEKEANYSHTISAKTWDAEGAKSLSDVSWTLANNGNYYGYDADRGQQIGSGSNPASSMTLSTAGLSGTIKQVTIYTSGGKDVNATVAVSVNSVDYLSGGDANKAISSTNTDYTFTGSQKGEIVISWAQSSSKALYIKRIDVVYGIPEVEDEYTGYTTTVAQKHAVTFSDPEHGTLVVKQGDVAITSGDKFVAGTNLQVVATPNEDYYLESLTVNGIDILDSRNFNMPDAAANVVATFAEKPEAPIAWMHADTVAKNLTIYLDKEYTLPTLSNEQSLVVELVSSNESVAVFNGTELKVAGVGDATISAEFLGNSSYKAKKVSYDLKVVEKYPTAINNIDSNEAVVKTMENGVLIIRRGNKTFNAQGQLLK